MRIIILSAVVVSVSACAGPQSLCDRDAVSWDKWGTTTLPAECLPPPVVLVSDGPREGNDKPTPKDTPDDKPNDGPDDKPNNPDDDPDGPTDDDHPTDEPDVSKPDDNKKEKDDNSDANGKGGNKHDRQDKDRNPQEIAEGKKNA